MEVIRQIDPGLIEYIHDNTYLAHIYPITKDRRMRVDYTTPLVFSNDGHASFVIPRPNVMLDKSDISVQIAGENLSRPIVSGLEDIQFESTKTGWILRSHYDQIKPAEHVVVDIPQLPDIVSEVENFKDEHYFVASVKVDRTETTIPDKFRIIWDASGSRTPQSIEKARHVLENLPETATYELHVFRNTLEDTQQFSTRSELLSAIDSLDYDGGTSFSDLYTITSQEFAGSTLFFTDGIHTMGNSLPKFMSTGVCI